MELIVSPTWRIIPILFVSWLIDRCNGQGINFVNFFCLDTGNYTRLSTYQENLRAVFSGLTTQASVKPFYNDTAGSGQDKVYGLYFCRYDISSELCRSCVAAARVSIQLNCPGRREAIAWYEECTLRYANRSIFSMEEVSPWAWWWSTTQVSDQGHFNNTVETTMTRLISQATEANSSRYFATGEAEVSLFRNVYGLVQCTPDIDSTECKSCLETALNKTEICCGWGTWAMVFLPSCQLRYDMAPFYLTEASSPAPLPSSPLASPTLAPGLTPSASTPTGGLSTNQGNLSQTTPSLAAAIAIWLAMCGALFLFV
ncbi:hypothetical protein Ancab_033639 [Ancistrocladus abbreviatus]